MRSAGGRQPAAAVTSYAPQPGHIQGDDRPIGQYTFTYQYGDDLFDESESIDSPEGSFLGECGVSISESLGSDEPKRVTALEVWLFNNGQRETITKVVMSTYAYDDEATHSRLSMKGEPVLAEPGLEIPILTDSLQMAVQIVDMAYGNAGMPEESYFERMVLHLTVWPNA